MNTRDTSSSPFLHLLLRTAGALLAVSASAGLPGCGDGGLGGVNEAATSACEAACDATMAACPAADDETCRSLCDAYGITVDRGSSCETAFLAWQACVENQTYECTTFDGTTYAVPADLDACDAESAAHDQACY